MAIRNLILRFAFGFVFTLLSVLVMRTRIVDKLSALKNRTFDSAYFAVFAMGHFVLFASAFLVLHQKPWADLPAFYVPEAHSAMRGLFPYRDFVSSYGPLNSYLDAAVLRLKDSPLSILVLQIVCDIAAVPFWIGFFRRFMSERAVRMTALLYLFQPLVLWEICLDGKNQGMICLLLAISLYTIARNEVRSGLSYSGTLILVKILPLMFFPAFFLASRKRVLWVAGAILPLVLVGGLFELHHADILEPLKVEGALSTPQNLPYVFSGLTGVIVPFTILSLLRSVPLLAAVAYAGWAQLRLKAEAERLPKLLLSILLVLFAVLIFNSKSDTSYLGMCFYLICGLTVAQIDRGNQKLGYAYVILSAMALPVASFWFWPLSRPSGVELHALWMAGDKAGIIMMGMQLLLVYSYLHFGWSSAKGLLEFECESRKAINA